MNDTVLLIRVHLPPTLLEAADQEWSPLYNAVRSALSVESANRKCSWLVKLSYSWAPLVQFEFFAFLAMAHVTFFH